MFEVVGIPAFDDNYIWILHNGTSAVVVDPGDDEPVAEFLKDNKLVLDAILITHKHWDHIGGISQLTWLWPEAIVYGPENEPIDKVDVKLQAGDKVSLLKGISFTVLDVPGHTEGHIAYLGEGRLFCGDTLFAGGCGRVFSGTHEQLSASLQQLSALPGETLVYCAHEYTVDNLGFGLWVEPENQQLIKRMEQCKQLRQQQLPTVPSTIAIENQTNPFMRTQEPNVVQAAEHWAKQSLADASSVFTALRTWKDKEYD